MCSTSGIQQYLFGDQRRRQKPKAQKELVKNIIYCSDGRPICVTPEVSGVQQNVATCELNEKKKRKKKKAKKAKKPISQEETICKLLMTVTLDEPSDSKSDLDEISDDDL